MWFFLVLLTALLTSLQDVFTKKITGKVDAYLIAWAWMFFSLPFLYLLLWIGKIPPLGPLFWKTAFMATVLLTFATIFYVKAIKMADLSMAVPMLSFTPVLLLGTSPLILGEFPKWIGVFGILLVVAGSYLLNFKERYQGYLAPFKSLMRDPGQRYMLMVALIYSISANLDKIGVNHSSALMWILSINTALAVTLGLVMLKKTKNIGQQMKTTWPFLIGIGFLNTVAPLCQMMALQLTLVAYVIAIKRTSVLFTSLFGFILFKEEGLVERMLGVLLMVMGVFVILLS